MSPSAAGVRPARRLRLWVAAGAFLLLAANVVNGIGSLGRRAGVTYVWVCRESGSELSYNPSVFPGTARLVPGRNRPAAGYRWEPVGPARPSPWRPWNWLAVLLEEPYPDPDAILREKLPHGDLSWRAEPRPAHFRSTRRTSLAIGPAALTARRSWAGVTPSRSHQ